MTSPVNYSQFKNFQPAIDSFNGKVILVTGAGSGIGRELSLKLASLGASVILLGKTLSKLEQVYDQIEQANYPIAAISEFDLATAGKLQYQQLLENIGIEFGRLDGLVHNASILGELTPLEHLEQDIWDQVININLTSNFKLTQTLLPLLKQSEDASLIFTSSGVGRKGRAYWGPYAVSKFAVEGLMQVLADELETNTSIRVNSINPGATRTQMRASAYPGEDPTTLPSPQQILPGYLFLLSEASKDINGQALSARDFIEI
jgi:NAD(P)-dependent dehydrogenase (short-subunit alcohol dehydrogenase family)